MNEAAWRGVILGAILAGATQASAASVACTVPRVDTCEGCLRKVTVHARPDGTCRVTFDIARDAFSGAPAGRRLDAVAVEVLFEPARRRWPEPRRRPAELVSRPLPSGPCFTFNAQRYCE